MNRARALAPMLLAATLLVTLAACGGDDGAGPSSPTPSSRSATPSAAASAAASPTASSASSATASAASPAPSSPDALPDSPSLGDDALPGQLTRAVRTVADPAAAEADVRRAALFEQLAARLLAEAPRSRAEAVVAGLGSDARAQLDADVAAARELHALTDPQPRLPRWRIVTPPPPAELLGDYRRAARATGVPWTYLAAIHLVETRMGRIRGTSTAGAQGPMQFLPPTFEEYGAGGDIDDPADAIMAAARLLRAHGAPGHLDAALYAYNHSAHYVRAVTIYARRMRQSPAAYVGYWHWQVLYRRTDATLWLAEGYPGVPARRVAG